MRLVALVLAALALAASPPQWPTFRANGISVRYPPSWFATSRQLTPVDAPSQVLAVASYRLPRGNLGADGCQPKEALDRMTPRGAFVFGWEYGEPVAGGIRARDFPPRPRRFKLTSFALRVHGAELHAPVQGGTQVLPDPRRPRPPGRSRVRATVLRIMDSFRAKRG